MAEELDPILLEVLWTRMLGIAEEVGKSIVRTGFSTILRENHDYSVGVFDANGKMLAQSVESATGHIGAMPYLAKSLLERHPPDTLEPGDVLITNDPWIGCGHADDVYIGSPAFRSGRFVGMVITSAHQVDIGGRLASAESREVYEEGLLLPPLKFYRRGQPNTDLHEILRLNLRFPDKVLGDLRAQVSATYVGTSRMTSVMDEYHLDSLAPLGEAIVSHTEERMREAIRQLPDGRYTASSTLEESDDNGVPLLVRVKVDVKGDEVHVDYEGTSLQCSKPINCVLNYTRAYTVLGIKLLLTPGLPNNEGSYRPIKLSAPKGSILNCEFPAPVYWRLFVGLRLPEIIFEALADAAPDRVLAGSGASPMWLFTISGYRGDGRPFILNTHAMGGLGARSDKDGLAAVAFPPNLQDIPTEIVENETPLIVTRREYRIDSGGPGTTRGGLGEILELQAPIDGDLDSGRPILIQAFPGRLRVPAKGIAGGLDGATGEVRVNGVRIDDDAATGRAIRMRPGDRISFLTPGGGGFGDPLDRSSQRVGLDVARGYVSPEAASSLYGGGQGSESVSEDPEPGT